MLKCLVFFAVFSIILICCLELSKAAKVDNVLTVSTDSGYLTVQEKPYPGYFVSFCTWMKAEGQGLTFFEARNAENDNLYISLGYTIFGYTGMVQPNPKSDYYYSQTAYDCNFKNVSGWFHFCAIYDSYDFYFYLNALEFQNYVFVYDVKTNKPDKLKLLFGNIYGLSGNNVSFYRTTVLGRDILNDEILNIYRCKPIKGDLLDWQDITSKSPDIQFSGNIKLMQDDVPCPDRPIFVPKNCSTNETIEYPPDPDKTVPNSEGQDSGSNSGSSNPSTSFGTSNPNSNAVNSNPSSSAGNSNPSTTAGTSNPSSNAGTTNPSSGSGTSNPSSSAGNSNPSSSAGTTKPSTGSGNSNPSSSAGNSNPSSSAGGMNSGESSQGMNSGSNQPSSGN